MLQDLLIYKTIPKPDTFTQRNASKTAQSHDQSNQPQCKMKGNSYDET